MDKGLIKNIKRRYRKGFIESLLLSDDVITVKEFGKATTILIFTN